MAEQSSAELRARRDELLSERSGITIRHDQVEMNLDTAANNQVKQDGQEIIEELRPTLYRAGFSKNEIDRLAVKLEKSDWSLAYKINGLAVDHDSGTIRINANKTVSDLLIEKDALDKRLKLVDCKILTIQKTLQELEERTRGIS